MKIAGIEAFLYRNCKTIYEISKREVYIPLVKEFYDCARVLPHKIIRTRENTQIVDFDVQEVAAALGVNLSDGEKYAKECWTNVDGADFI